MAPREPAGETLARAMDNVRELEEEGRSVTAITVLLAFESPPDEEHPTGTTSYREVWTYGTPHHEAIGLLMVATDQNRGIVAEDD